MTQPDAAAHQSQSEMMPAAGWKTTQVYAMAVVCLALGLALGYLFRGSQGKTATVPVANATTEASTQPEGMPAGHPMPTLEQMKKIADTKAEPLLTQLKADPKNASLLVQVGKIYQSTHQFKDAAVYYGKALEVNPKDVPTRTQMASCMYYDGDVDGAISQLQRALQDQPKDANSLFNLGMIKWQGKNDGPGAIAAWQKLLKTNPQLEESKKAQVQKLIAQAQAGQPATLN